jgi:predicted dinucleotide-binding enzyme
MTALLSGGSFSSSSSLLESLALGVREAHMVEKAPSAETSTQVLTLRKEEDPAATPMANLVSVPPVDAASMGVDSIILSSDSEDEVDWEALVAGDEVDHEALVAEDVDDVESVGSWSPSRTDGGLDTLLLTLALMLA